MNNEALYSLGILYFLMATIYTIIEIVYLINKKELTIITFIRAMFTIVYGYAQGAVFTSIKTTPFVYLLDLSEYGIKKMYFLFFMSIIVYIFINIGYFYLGKYTFKKNNIKIAYKEIDKSLFIAAIIILMIGTLSLLLWTKVFGGPIAILPYANQLRSGVSNIYNPWSFMMKFCMLSLFSTYIFIGLWSKNRLKKYIVFAVISTIPSILYLLANSSRMMLIMYFIFSFLIHNQVNYIYHNKAINLTKYFFIAIIGLVLMRSAESIMLLFQEKSKVINIDISFNVLDILKNEFFYPAISGQGSITAFQDNVVNYRFFQDIISGILSWLPSRFRPEYLPRLEDINTLYIMGTTKLGYLPPDFLAVCMYDFGYLGFIILPSIFGILARKVHFKYVNSSKNILNIILYILGSFYFLKAIGYADLSNIMSNIFYIFIAYVIIKFVRLFFRRNKFESNI